MVETQAAEGAAHRGSQLPNPMHQFEIERIIPLKVFGFDASFTNSALFMVIAASLITLFTLYAMRSRALVPSRVQSVAELSYEFVANMVRDNVGTDGMKYFPFVFTLFFFILFGNLKSEERFIVASLDIVHVGKFEECLFYGWLESNCIFKIH